MGVKNTISNIGSYALGIIIMAVLFSIPIIFIRGGVWVGERALPWLMLLSLIVLGINIVILLPLVLFRTTRPWAGLGFFISSYVFGLTGWFMGLLLTWMIWGGMAVIIGLCFAGVGVVPIAMLATLLHGMWPEFGLLVLAIVLTYGLRILGITLTENS